MGWDGCPVLPAGFRVPYLLCCPYELVLTWAVGGQAGQGDDAAYELDTALIRASVTASFFPP